MQARLILEYYDDASSVSAPVKMRWERSSDAAGEDSSAFGLLGRAFEAAQREEKRSFEEGLLAFFKGAMIHREDLEEVLRRMPPQSAQ